MVVVFAFELDGVCSPFFQFLAEFIVGKKIKDYENVKDFKRKGGGVKEKKVVEKFSQR